MKRRVLSTIVFSRIAGLCLVLAAVISPLASAQDKKPAPAPMKLNVGDVAPDFKLQYFTGSDLKDVSLSQYRGKSNVVLAFYVFAFTGG
jgi:hypothetical protein